jgi:hypothetical protein
MSNPGTYNFPAVVRGDTIPAKVFTLTNTTTSTPIDLTGATVSITFKTSDAVTTVTKDTASGMTLTDASNGVVTLDAFIMTVAGEYDYDMQVTDSSSVITTYLKGKLSVAQDIDTT